jgi:cytochrome c peroxidase
MNKKYLFWLIVFLPLVSCNKPIEVRKSTPYNLPQPAFFPTARHGMELTVECIELGRHLFYDGRLSGRTQSDSMFSCASCHKQQYAFEAGYNVNGRALGIKGALTPHSMLPLINLAFVRGGYTWNGNVESIESIVRATLIDTIEMAGNIDTIVKRIAAVSLYPPLFEAAFGTSGVTAERICTAVTQFIVTLVSSDSRFDRYVTGRGTLSDDELMGYQLFSTEEGADCFHCHGGQGNMLFSTYLMANNGLDADGIPYRIPTLRNIGFTAPYMHDGRFQTLDEVIDHYSEHVKFSPTISPLMHHLSDGGVWLTPREKQQLKAFLLSLNDTAFVTNPAFSDPFNGQ